VCAVLSGYFIALGNVSVGIGLVVSAAVFGSVGAVIVRNMVEQISFTVPKIMFQVLALIVAVLVIRVVHAGI